jgi:hypothetical protein
MKGDLKNNTPQHLLDKEINLKVLSAAHLN